MEWLPMTISGMAWRLQLQERWSTIHKAFRHYCQGSTPKSGELWNWVVTGNRSVPPSREGKPGTALVDNVNHCLNVFRKTIEFENYSSEALPKLATGVRGIGLNRCQAVN